MHMNGPLCAPNVLSASRRTRTNWNSSSRKIANPSEPRLCYDCMKYLVSIDFRDRADEVVREAAPLGLVYLDVLAQDKGFSPGATCAWNVMDQE